MQIIMVTYIFNLNLSNFTFSFNYVYLILFSISSLCIIFVFQLLLASDELLLQGNGVTQHKLSNKLVYGSTLQILTQRVFITVI